MIVKEPRNVLLWDSVDIFILHIILILHLNVRDNSDNLPANVTLITNTRTHTAFHKALYAKREINDFDVVLFQLHWSIHVPITVSERDFLFPVISSPAVQWSLQ